MEKQIFSDGIGTLSIIGNTVRLDFVTVSATEKAANGIPKAVFQQRVVMSLEAFLQSAAKMQELAANLSARIANPSKSEPPSAPDEAKQAKRAPSKRPFP